jgi:tetratricopeptide (TPR) repeat protein
MATETETAAFKNLTARFIGSKQWERAQKVAADWLAADPENLQAHRVAAQSLINLGRHAEAEPHTAYVLTRRPRDDYMYRLVSNIRLDNKNFAAALEAIGTAISINPDDFLHWYQRGRVCFYQKEYGLARQWLIKARELNPQSADVVQLLASCEANTSDGRARELAMLLEALALNPEKPGLHNDLGAYHLNIANNPVAAEECFRQALEKNPTSKLYRVNLFKTLIVRFKSDNQWERVLGAACDIQAIEPENLYARRMAAEALNFIERYDEAILHLDAILSRTPNDDLCLRLKCNALLGCGRVESAFETINRALEINPKSARSWAILARMWLDQGDRLAALRAARKAEALDPNDSVLRKVAVKLAGQNSQPAKKPIDPPKGNPVTPGDYNDAGVYHSNVARNYAEAETFFRRAVEMKPDSALYRGNYLIALSRTRFFYRVLNYQTMKASKYGRALRGVNKDVILRNALTTLMLLALWVYSARLVITTFVIWSSIVWPMKKLYEMMAIRAILTENEGKTDARCGWTRHFMQMPAAVWSSVLGATLLSSWAVVGLIIQRHSATANDIWRSPLFFTGCTVAPLVWVLGFALWKKAGSVRKKFLSSRIARRFGKLR